MQVRVKYRIHGILEQPLLPDTLVELDEATALDLIRQGAVEELVTVLPLPDSGSAESEVQARCTELEAAFKAEREHSLVLEQEVFRLRDALAECQKELAKAQKSAKASKNAIPDEEKA